MDLTIPDAETAPSRVEPTGPPIGLLVTALLAELIGVVGLFVEPVRIWTIAGYVLCAVAATLAVAGFRLTDGRRRPLPGYRIVGYARPASSVLLLAAWLIASGDAWRLATVLSR